MSRVLLASQPTDGGVGRHLSDVALGLTERGFEVIVCAPELPSSLSGRVEYAELDLGRAIAARRDVVAITRFAKLVRELRPSLVHAHSSKAGAVARLARLAAPRVPVIYTPHGYAFAGHFSRESERRVYRGVERLLAPATSRFVCVCEAEARLARSVGAGGRVRVVHNGIEPPGEGPVDQAVAELAGRGPVIGALTMLRPGKGLETLLEAMPALLARHADTQLAIVGAGPDRETLAARAGSLSVSHAVHFLGERTDPFSVLRGLDVFVHPSWAESFPYVVLEAMSLGRTILASDVGGVAEAIVDGESGVLVKPRDEQALAAALADLLDDPARRTYLGEQALARQSERFTRDAMIEDLADVYDEVVKAASGTTPRDRPLADSPLEPPAMSGRLSQ